MIFLLRVVSSFLLFRVCRNASFSVIRHKDNCLWDLYAVCVNSYTWRYLLSEEKANMAEKSAVMACSY